MMKTQVKTSIVFNDRLTGREKQTYSKRNTLCIDHVNRFQNHVLGLEIQFYIPVCQVLCLKVGRAHNMF